MDRYDLMDMDGAAALFFDLDDTLCPSGEHVDFMTADFLQRIKKKYCAKLILCTGSSRESVMDRTKEIEFDYYMTGLGSCIYTPAKTLYQAPPLEFIGSDSDTLSELIMGSDFGVNCNPFKFHTNNSVLSASVIGKDYPPERRVDYINHDEATFERMRFVRQLRNDVLFSEKYDVYLGGRTALDIVNKGHGKHDSISSSICNYDGANTFFFGDAIHEYGGDWMIDSDVFSADRIIRVKDHSHAYRMLESFVYGERNINVCL